MVLNLILLCALVVAGLWTVMTTRLLRSVIGLALTSAILSIIMFRLFSPIAAAFELSVCAGLISVIFVTTISFTQRISQEDVQVRRRERLARFWTLPLIVIIAFLLLIKFTKPGTFKLAQFSRLEDVRFLIWNLRHLDLLGQIAIILAGVFGVVMLFKEPKR